MQQINPIDAVIAWVDGNDPKHKEKIKPFLNKQNLSDDIAGPTRYRSVGEIFYCVASILRFAPFIRKIFIITDNQNPQLDSFLKSNFPQSTTKIEIVDHTVIFEGYEKYLPVFNSISIETAMYRIPGLSENFVYFNDDFFLLRPAKASDWYVEDKIVAYGKWRYILPDKLLWLVKPLKNGRKPLGFKDTMISAAIKYGCKWKYFHVEHMPHPLKRSVLERFFSLHPELFLSNISYKFRHPKQFMLQEIYYLIMIDKAKAIIETPAKKFIYMKPVNRASNYVQKKINKFNSNNKIQFGCVGSLDMATQTDQLRIKEWFCKELNIEFT